MLIICFEDAHVERLAPVIHARPAYAITCGSFRLVDWLNKLVADQPGSELVGDVREYLRPIQKLDFQLEPVPGQIGKHAAAKDGVLLVNARVVPSVQMFEKLLRLSQSDGLTVASRGETTESLKCESIDAAWIPKASLPPDDTSLANLLKLAAEHARGNDDCEPLHTFHWPHDIVAQHMKAMASAAEYRVQHGDFKQLQDGVFVAPDVSIGDYASIDTSAGPIVLESGVQVGPFCYLQGPLHAGHNTRVIEHASIKDGVCLGHTTKIGGEVEASVVEPYTNKQHHGFLGHSYLGSWINLGAGTCNSDLKNTYGKINITYGREKVATGMQFVGCIMGDYSKSAINTGIFTGKVIGVCSMMYGFVTSNVPSYVNYARLFGQTSLLPPEVMVNTQARMFARRKVQQRECDIQLIHDMYAGTVDERQASDELVF